MAAISLTKREARVFMLRYHGLYGDYAFEGKEGILSYIRRVGCIQFDPLNVVGMNPELVLQSRIAGFDRRMLQELLYDERKLVDYWDKCLSIFPVEDWPNFARLRRSHQGWCDTNPELAERVREEIERRGPVSSADLEYNDKVDWYWGPTRLSRAALEGMYHAGRLVVHHKTNTRKFYDLAERYIPDELFGKPDPFGTDAAYYEWFVLRRIGSLGLLWNRPSDAWIGIRGMKSAERNAAFAGLADKGLIREARVEGVAHPLYLRAADIGLLEEALAYEPKELRTSLLAPLDNFMWDRKLIRELFGFEYRWEVYKPAAERQYGYYVLPVVHGDRIVARVEPAKQRKQSPLSLLNWWWENDVEPSAELELSAIEGLRRFAGYLGTSYEHGELPIAGIRGAGLR